LHVKNTKAYKKKAEVQICTFLTLALDKGKRSFLWPPFLFIVKGPQYPLSRKLVAPVKNMDILEQKNLTLFYPWQLEVFYGLPNIYYRVKTLLLFS